jgi:hypothetical protein
MTFPLALSIALIITTCAAPAAAATKILKQEPPMGGLKLGQKVLVDDGKCPAGQVRQVIGGDHTKVGGRLQIERTSQCVPRP